MIRVLITGASGFIGNALTQHLASASVLVSTSSRNAGGGLQLSPEVEFFDPRLFAHFDVVVHCAARVHQMKRQGQSDMLYYRDNVLFPRNLAAACAKAGVKHFVFISSIKVLGDSTGVAPFNAVSVPNPQDSYARSKLMAENVLKECVRDSGMALSIVRIPLVYGPEAKGNLAALGRMASRGVPLPLGGIRNRRNLLGMSNLCEFITHLIVRGGRFGCPEVFLLADERPVSTPEVYTYLGKRCGKRIYLPEVPSILWRLIGKVPGFRPIVDRLTGNLEVDISETIRATEWSPRHESLTD